MLPAKPLLWVLFSGGSEHSQGNFQCNTIQCDTKDDTQARGWVFLATAEQGPPHSALAHSALAHSAPLSKKLTFHALARTMLTSSCKSAEYGVECKCIDRVDQIPAGFTSPVALEGVFSALDLLTVVKVLHGHSAFSRAKSIACAIGIAAYASRLILQR